MDEKEIIKGCCENDRRCQNALYKKYFPLISSIALRYFSNKDDALQGINFGFLKVLQNIKKYSNDYALATWIRKIMVNHCIDEFRKNKSYLSTIHLKEESNNTYVEYNEAETRMNTEELQSMLNELPNVTSKVFNMYAIDGFKHKEIAERLNISIGTSKWHVSEARKRLRNKIEEIAMLEKKREVKNLVAR